MKWFLGFGLKNCSLVSNFNVSVNFVLSRFLIASMQSICLEGLGGENKVDPRLQETTFIQHVFGGRLRSKVLIAPFHTTYL